jgi:hypothetical protein
MKNVVPKGANIIVSFHLPSLSDDAVCGSRIYALL